MRKLGLAALRARGTRGPIDAIVNAATTMGADATRTLLGYCHWYLLLYVLLDAVACIGFENTRSNIVAELVAEIEVFEHCERAFLGWLPIGFRRASAIALVQVRTARGAEALAILAAERYLRDLKDDRGLD